MNATSFDFNKNNGIKITAFSRNEFFSLLFLILTNVIFVFCLLGSQIFIANNYFVYLDNFGFNGSSYFIPNQIYLLIVFTSFLSLLLPINLSILASTLYFYKKIDKNNLIQIVKKLILYNFITFLPYIIILTLFGATINLNESIQSDYYTPEFIYNSWSVFYNVLILAIIFLGIIILITIFSNYSSFKSYLIKKNGNQLSNFKILRNNLLLFLIINSVFLILIPKNHPLTNINEILLFSIGFNVSVFFLKFIFDNKFSHLNANSLLKSIGLNFLLTLIITAQFINIYGFRSDYLNYYLIVDNFQFVYMIIWLSILIYYFRNSIKHYFIIIISKSRKYSKIIAEKLVVLFKKINPASFVFYYFTLRTLNKNDHAVYFTKKFIILQSKHLKNALPGVYPKDIPVTIQKIFENDIERLQQLFKVNNIKTYSNKAVVRFVMLTANLIIKDLQKTLQEHLTEELLKESNDVKSLHINIEELWGKSNKIMLQWESTFTDSELTYQDSLLHK